MILGRRSEQEREVEAISRRSGAAAAGGTLITEGHRRAVRSEGRVGITGGHACVAEHVLGLTGCPVDPRRTAYWDGPGATSSVTMTAPSTHQAD